MSSRWLIRSKRSTVHPDRLSEKDISSVLKKKEEKKRTKIVLSPAQQTAFVQEDFEGKQEIEWRKIFPNF